MAVTDPLPDDPALTPAQQLVYLALAHDGPLSRQDLQKRLDLHARTIDYALSDLRAHGLVDAFPQTDNPDCRHYDATLQN